MADTARHSEYDAGSARESLLDVVLDRMQKAGKVSTNTPFKGCSTVS